MSSDADDIIAGRSKRSSNDLDFLSESLDKILRSQIENQDEVLKHQTNLIQQLVNSRNDTAVLDQHFFNLVTEIRRGYIAVRESIASRVMIPHCPEATATLLVLSISLGVSLLLHVVIMIAAIHRAFKR